MNGGARRRSDPDISRARRGVRNSARTLHERLNVALIRWGRARLQLDSGGSDRAEFENAERELLEIYREFDTRPGT